MKTITLKDVAWQATVLRDLIFLAALDCLYDLPELKTMERLARELAASLDQLMLEDELAGGELEPLSADLEGSGQ